MKKIIVTIGLLLFGVLFVVCILTFRPIPIVKEEKAVITEGIVMNVYDGGSNSGDVIIRLKDDDRIYYINRGLHRGLNIDKLKEKILGEKIVLKYPNYWTPLDWNNSLRHISKVEFGNEILFNELKN